MFLILIYLFPTTPFIILLILRFLIFIVVSVVKLCSIDISILFVVFGCFDPLNTLSYPMAWCIMMYLHARFPGARSGQGQVSPGSWTQGWISKVVISWFFLLRHPPSGPSLDSFIQLHHTSHWVGLREIYRKPGFLPSNIGLSCKISHHPILWTSSVATTMIYMPSTLFGVSTLLDSPSRS